MDQLSVTLIGLCILLASVPVGVFVIKRVRGSRNMAAFAGLVLLFSPFVKPEPPRPPAAESIAEDDDDEPLDLLSRG